MKIIFFILALFLLHSSIWADPVPNGKPTNPLLSIANEVIPQEPKRPFPYLEEPVSFVVDEGVTLSGTFTRPQTGPPFPTVLLLASAGSFERDGHLWTHHPMLVLSDYLTRRGIATLRCDQRGVRFSTGHPSQGGLDVQALDDLMCVRYLKSRTDVNISKIGIIGCDHGGLLAIKCAAYSADVAYIVLLGTPSLDGTNEILEKNKSISKAEGMSDRAVSLQYNLVSDIIETVKKDEDDEMALEDIRKIAMVYGNAMTEDDKNELKNFFQVFNIADRGLASRQWRYAINYDPHDDLVKVKCPVLSLYGGKDFAVPVDENIPLFKKAMEEGKNQDYTVKVFPGLNNQFQTAKTGLFSEYAYLPETISPLVLDFIGDWIGKHAQ